MTGFFRSEQVHADTAELPDDLMPALRAGEIHAVLVKGVYPAEAMHALLPVLENNTPGFVETSFPKAFNAEFYGINLNLADANLDPYFEKEPAFSAALDAMLSPALTDHVTGLMSRLDQGRRYRAAPGPGPGQRHFFTTLRSHRTGGYIPPHFDNEVAVRQSYRHVAAQTQGGLVSFVLAFSQADAGGALRFYNLRSETHAARFRNVGTGAQRPSVDAVPRVDIRLDPGDLILVNSGGYLHEVTKVRGPTTRWTACSFMALAKDGAEVFCWG